MLIILEEHTDPPDDNPVVARDINGAEHALTVVARAGMVCIQELERQESAYIMHRAAALQLGLQLIWTCVSSRRSPARRGCSPHERRH